MKTMRCLGMACLENERLFMKTQSEMLMTWHVLEVTTRPCDDHADVYYRNQNIHNYIAHKLAYILKSSNSHLKTTLSSYIMISDTNIHIKSFSGCNLDANYHEVILVHILSHSLPQTRKMSVKHFYRSRGSRILSTPVAMTSSNSCRRPCRVWTILNVRPLSRVGTSHNQKAYKNSPTTIWNHLFDSFYTHCHDTSMTDASLHDPPTSKQPLCCRWLFERDL